MTKITSMNDYLLNKYGFDEDYEESDEDMASQELDVRIKIFYSRLRSHVYNQIIKQPGGGNQWLYIIGKKSRDANGYRITYSKKTFSILQRIVDYYNTTEGLDQLQEFGIEAPEHPDDLMYWIANALTSRQLSAETFKFAMKNFRKNFFGMSSKK